MGFRPSKWILYSPVAVLPFLAALFVEGRGLQDDVARRVADNVAKAGGSWATSSVEGRDVKLAGDAPSAAQMDAAIAAAVGTYGVRRVESAVRVVEPPPAAPVITPQSGIWGSFDIAGSWPESNGNVLSVGLAGKSWTAGKNPELATDGAGKWTLKPAIMLEPGTYDVTATVTSVSGLVSNDSSTDEITVAAPPELKAPTVESLDTASATPVIRGTWDPAVATSLSVTVGPAAYKLGTDAALSGTGGNWTLSVPQPLADGTYDVTAEVGDALGRSVKTAAPGKLLVDTTAPHVPVVDPVTSSWPLKVTGSWDAADAVSLTATLAGKTWTLGKDKALSSDSEGKWSFTPDIDLAPGTYDLGIEIADKLGNIARDASKDEIVVAPLPELKAPTVDSIITNVPAPVVTGTWPSAVARTLVVKLRDTAFALGAAKELSAEGDNWRLQLPSPLTDGGYDVSAEVSDARGRTMAADVPGKLTIDTVMPAAPSIAPVSGVLPLKVSGNWAEGDAVSLVVKLAGKVWSLGKDAALSSDGEGHWSFSPNLDLQPGTYDLGVEITDRAGNVSRDATKDEIVIAAPPPPPPVMQAPTVTASEALTARPVIRGTWSELAAKTLQVAVGGQTYVLGSNPELTSDGIGNWALAVAAPLGDGAYDVAVQSTDANGLTLTDRSGNELVVDAKGPEVPTVGLFAGQASPGQISGTWDSESATALKVSIPLAGLEATLGESKALTSSAGQWTLALSQPLAPGSYDVVVETTDAKGRLAKDQTRFELFVKEPPPPPPQMKAPTVSTYSSTDAPAAISGTWDEGVAKTLAVAIDGAGEKAALGMDKALTSDGKGNWTLALASTLGPGIYDVMVETTDAQGSRLRDTTTAELYIKAPPPPPPPPPPQMKAPTVGIYAGLESPAAITGTWDEGVAKTLSVSIDGTSIKAALGSDPALASDGKGNWTLALANAIAPGIYDVAVSTADAEGNTISDTSTAELYIKAPPPPPPPPPYDCDAEFIAAVSTLPIRFQFDRWDLSDPALKVIQDIASVLKDERCLTRRIEVSGHADYFGGKLYNEALSLRRAEVVVDALQAEGVAADRMTAIGLGEANPEDPQRTRDARAKNRRVILTMLK